MQACCVWMARVSVCSSQTRGWFVPLCYSTCVELCAPHRALGMMVKGRMGLLASSSRAVRKHSVAAAAFP